jgi:hypothetical protein
MRNFGEWARGVPNETRINQRRPTGNKMRPASKEPRGHSCNGIRNLKARVMHSPQRALTSKTSKARPGLRAGSAENDSSSSVRRFRSVPHWRVVVVVHLSITRPVVPIPATRLAILGRATQLVGRKVCSITPEASVVFQCRPRQRIVILANPKKAAE